jgi:hypothetical protein
MAKFKFTQQDLDDMIIKALQEQPTKGGEQVGTQTQKPAIMQKLLAKAGLNKRNQ